MPWKPAIEVLENTFDENLGHFSPQVYWVDRTVKKVFSMDKTSGEVTVLKEDMTQLRDVMMYDIAAKPSVPGEPHVLPQTWNEMPEMACDMQQETGACLLDNVTFPSACPSSVR